MFYNFVAYLLLYCSLVLTERGLTRKLFSACLKENDNLFSASNRTYHWLVKMCEMVDVFLLLCITDYS